MRNFWTFWSIMLLLYQYLGKPYKTIINQNAKKLLIFAVFVVFFLGLPIYGPYVKKATFRFLIARLLTDLTPCIYSILNHIY